MKYLFLILSLFASAVLYAEDAASGPPSVEALFKNPEFRAFKLSPDGKTLAMLAPHEGAMNLHIYDLETRKAQILTQEKIDITEFHWVNNERLIYSMNQGTFGNYERRFSGGIVGVDKDGSDYAVLVQPFRSRGRGVYIAYLDRHKEDDDWVLVTNNERRRDRPDMFLMNVHTGSLKKVFNNPARINQYYLDECGKPRFGISMTSKAKMNLWYRTVDSEEWAIVQEESEDFQMITPVYISCDSDMGIVALRGDRDRSALFRYNFLTGEMSDEPILEDDIYDIDASPITSFGGTGLVGFRYDADKPRQLYFEENHKALQEMIDNLFPGAYNVVSSVDDKGKRLVIGSSSDVKAPAYYILHLDDMRMETLAPTRPWLDNYDLPPTRPISYESRDGRTIHGYLTLPADYEKGDKAPLIANPHGGPWARDNWGLRNWISYEPKFYASRGFAVLQMNFRGSTGYGQDHLTSSFKDLEAMHHDVIDGILWAIDEGIADPDKIGIGGASWGGYATMTALTKNPELFQFGINIFGVVDLVEHINTYIEWGRDSGYEYWLKRIGDPSDDEDRKNLEEWSAINYVEQIDDPVFIYHGLRDFNVDIEQSRMLARELKKHDKEYEFVFRTDEAHSAFDEENRIDLYTRIDAFLKEVTADW